MEQVKRVDPVDEDWNQQEEESAVKDATRQHPSHRSFEEVVKRVDPVDEEWNQEEESSNERLHLPLWKLAFRTPPQLPIFTGSKIVGKAGKPLEVILVDPDTSSPAAPPQALRVELVPVFGDFPPDGREDWSADEFQRSVVKEREGRRPLLTGDVRLTMKDGRATAGELQFTDNSSWIRCRKFRIGARVVPGSYDGGWIAEAITEAFMVRDHPGELYRKHYPPVLGDSVSRLEKIGMDGAFHRKLKNNNIDTVQEFLRMLTVKPDELRAILGDGMTDRMWEATTIHARTCVLDDKVYVYRTALGAIYVDSIFDLVRFEMGGIKYPPHPLNTDKKTLVQQLTLEAYEHRHNLQLHEQESDDPLPSWLRPFAVRTIPLLQDSRDLSSLFNVPYDPSLSTLTSASPTLQGSSLYLASARHASSSSLGHSFSSSNANSGVLQATKVGTEANPIKDLDKYPEATTTSVETEAHLALGDGEILDRATAETEAHPCFRRL